MHNRVKLLMKTPLKLILAILTTSKLCRLELFTNDVVLTFQYCLRIKKTESARSSDRDENRDLITSLLPLSTFSGHTAISYSLINRTQNKLS